MKKLLTLLAVSPLAITACSGGEGSIDARIERENNTYASVEVQAAVKALFEMASENIYSEAVQAAITADGGTVGSVDADGNPTDGRPANAKGARLTNWYSADQSGLFTDADIEWMTVGNAYRAALYFGIDTASSFENVGNLNGSLLNGMLADGVEHGIDASAPGYFPAQAKAVIEAIKEQEGDSGDYNMSIYQNAGAREDIATLAAGNLKAIGINMNLQTTDWPTHLERTYAGEHGAYVGGWTTVTGHAGYGLWGPFHSSAQGSGGNRQFVGERTIDEALETAAWASDAAGSYETAQEEIARLFATVPLYSGNRRMLYQNVTSGINEDIGQGTLQKAAHHDYGNVVRTGGGTFTVATTGKFASLHPHGSNDSSSTLINKHVYQSLWKQNSDAVSGGLEFESLLITDDANSLVSNNGKVTVTIDETVLWSDGQTLSADEVIDSINRAITEPQIAGVTPGVIGAEAGTNAGEVTIVFGEPNADTEAGEWITDTNELHADYANMVKVKDYSAWKQSIAHAGFAINKTTLEDHADTPASIVGTGRYTVKSVDITTNDVTLEKRTDYNAAGDVAQNDAIEFRVVADTTAAYLAFTSDEVDLVDAVTQEAFDSETVGTNAISYPTFSNNFIGINVWQKK